MTSWFRSWHGAPTDLKWVAVARRAGTTLLITVPSEDWDWARVKGVHAWRKRLSVLAGAPVWVTIKTMAGEE